MKGKEKIIMSWSGGKDSAMALYQILQEDIYEVKYLLTNIYEPNKRVSMHGVPEELIEKQAESIGIPLKKLYINEKTHKEYEDKMRSFLTKMKAEGVTKVAFGDIFLEDLKIYREQKLAEVDLHGIFPLWKKPTDNLAIQFIFQGFKTHICSIDLSKIPNHLIGVDYSDEFIRELPENVDPCGENGEFHSFCYAGPIFKSEIQFKKNEIVSKKYEHDGKSYLYLFSDISS
jgi:uncharacterized protein (TIGR00290 family)